MSLNLRQLGIAFAASGICFLHSWGDIDVLYEPETYFFSSSRPSPLFGFRIILLHSILTAIIYSGMRIASSAKQRPWRSLSTCVSWIGIFYLLLTLVCFLFIELWSNETIPPGVRAAVSIALPIILVYIGFRCRAQTPHYFGLLLTVVLPFCLYKVAETLAILILLPSPASFVAPPAGPTASGDVEPRIVWLIFDEMDYSMVFEDRPAGLLLPNLDRLKLEAVVATNATPPGEMTRVAIPSLISGRVVNQSTPIDADTLLLDLVGGQPTIWRPDGSLFELAADHGYRTSIVGWYLPYCRIFSELAVSCYSETTTVLSRQHWWYGMLEQTDALTGLWAQLVHNFSRSPLIAFLPVERREEEIAMWQALRHQHRSLYVSLRARLLRELSNSKTKFVFGHLPIPHPPGVFNRTSGELSVSTRNTYLDNLVLSDKLFGEIRQTMEKDGTWDNSVVILTSDHSLRDWIYRTDPIWTPTMEAATAERNLNRVPLLVKMPGQHKGVTFDRNINSIVVHSLIEGIIEDRISSVDHVLKLLNANARFTR